MTRKLLPVGLLLVGLLFAGMAGSNRHTLQVIRRQSGHGALSIVVLADGLGVPCVLTGH